MDVKIKVTNKDQVMKIYTSEDGFNIPSITMRALNHTAFQVKNALVEEMSKTFDRPTPYTLNALAVEEATTKNLRAFVVFRESSKMVPRSEHYLGTQVYGGERKLKSFESALRIAGILPQGMYAVPGQKAPLDAYGNITRGFIIQIISYFKAFGEQGYRANSTVETKEKIKKGTKKKRGMEYFAIREPGRGLKPGIYRKTSLDFRMGIGKTEPMIMFVKRPAYRQILGWDEIAKRVVDQNWVQNLKEAGMEP
jgi:hypothetical protein